jgi:hypothetical protein
LHDARSEAVELIEPQEKSPDFTLARPLLTMA